MRRPLTTCIALLMLWAFAQPVMTHVHAVQGRAPLGHSHGVASQRHQHQHQQRPHAHRARAEQTTRPTASKTPAGPGDTSQAAVRSARHQHDAAHSIYYVKLTTTSATHAFAAPFLYVDVQILTLEPPRIRAFFVVEPRQHGPPQRATIPARAPPSSFSA